MVSCPDGHSSLAADYCDVCGAPIGAVDPVAAAEASGPTPKCVYCGAERSGRFCEACGHDSALPAPIETAGTGDGEVLPVEVVGPVAPVSALSRSAAGGPDSGSGLDTTSAAASRMAGTGDSSRPAPIPNSATAEAAETAAGTNSARVAEDPPVPGEAAAVASGKDAAVGPVSVTSGAAQRAETSSAAAGSKESVRGEVLGRNSVGADLGDAEASGPHGSATAAAEVGPVWVVTITADRAFFDRVRARKGPDADRVEFPAFYPHRRIVLRAGASLIGKRSVSQGITPEIDLGLAPADIGVSRTHATLRATEEGLSITDLGSTNGTSLNEGDDLLPAAVPFALHSGDRIHLGGWTTLHITAEPG
ncbi:FHA domain-containing protein [Nocardia callitridis]|uniref:FHA domain-containing protein n=1 Tax=Nocardia callitridis TaxID=648753 RepID=A0ABP9K5X3_9NOCA